MLIHFYQVIIHEVLIKKKKNYYSQGILTEEFEIQIVA
jgi:hypothetical protein